MRRILLLFLLFAAGAIAAPASALAATRYASPTGSGSAPCTDPAHPCSLGGALGQQQFGDVIQLASGTYSTGSTVNTVASDVEIRGQPGAARPVLVGMNTTPLFLEGEGAVARDLEVDTNLGSALELFDADSAYDVLVRSSDAGTVGACQLDGNGTLVDSVCQAGGSNSAGLYLDPVPNGANVSLRGVTAIGASGTRAGLVAEPTATSATIDVRNSILRGDAHDVVLTPASGGVLQMFSSHSNFSRTAGTGTFTDDGTDQGTPPIFVNAHAGDYHPASGSPTIDAGDNTYAGGTTDLDGNPRILGAAVDIGAYEFVPPAPTVTTGTATVVTTGGATLNGTVDPHTNATTYWFQIGDTRTYGLTTATHPTAGGAVLQGVSGLAPGTTYHYRLVAQSASGTSFGGDQTFTTAVPPPGAPSPKLGTVAQATANAVVVELSCSVSTCRFTETLTVTGRLNTHTHAVMGVTAMRGSRRTRAVIVGSRALSVLSGDTTTSVIKLNAAGRKLLKRFHRLPVKLTVTVAGAGAPPLTAKLTLHRGH